MDPAPPPAPREIPSLRRLASFGTLFALLFGGIWMVTGGLITVVFMVVGGPPWNDWILDRRGVEAQADVLSVTPTSSYVNRRPVRKLSLVFRDHAGAEQTGSVGTTVGQGATVAIEYDPENPWLMRLKGGRASFFGPFTLLPMAFFLVGSGVFGWGALQMLKRKRIYRDGATALAVVVAIRATSGRINRMRVQRVEYEFKGTAGPVRGSYTTTTPPSPGTELWIIHDAADATLSLPA